jgi:hypothetical protein
METLENRRLLIFGWSLSFEGTSGFALYIRGILGEVLNVNGQANPLSYFEIREK